MGRTLTVVGFTSDRSAHAHLLKHVLRVTEVDPEGSAQDPEGWSEVLDDPPLVVDPGRRRQEALVVLAGVPGCAATQVTTEKPCGTCQHRGAIDVVSSKMRGLMSAYVAAASAALDSAFANPDRHGPRLVAYRDRDVTRIETVDSRHVRVIGLQYCDGAVRLVTCYRDRSRSLHSSWLELARIRAAHRRAGTLQWLKQDEHHVDP